MAAVPPSHTFMFFSQEERENMSMQHAPLISKTIIFPGAPNVRLLSPLNQLYIWLKESNGNYIFS